MTPTWNFTVLLNRPPTDQEADALYDAGLDDCAVITGGPGRPSYLDCDCEGPSLLAAVSSVVEQIKRVSGLRGVGVGADDTVTLGDAAQRLVGLRTQANLRQLAAGQRGPGGFPPPVAESDNVRLYSWASIAAWLRETLGDDVPEVNPDLAIADATLRLAARAEATNHTAEVRHLLSTA